MSSVSTFTRILLLVVFPLVTGDISPVVETKYGTIQGTHDGQSREGRHFYQFKGIQYAVIDERFKSAVPPKPWTGIKSATEFGPSCVFPEIPELNVTSAENCLFLNLYTPSLTTEANGSLLPVAIYLHGGAYKFNSGQNYGPDYLMDQDIIFVTINHRLGVLGFLSTEDESSPGNWGLKDQVMALRWVQDNIHAFGGDKNRGTIMGQSAGGVSVSLHLVSPMSAGLFQNAIVQSGTFLIPSIYTRKPLRYARKLAHYLGCNNTEDTGAIVSCLRDMPVEILANPQTTANATVIFFEDPITAFGPVTEPKIGNEEDAFLTESPLELLKSGRVHKVPLLSGLVKEEGIYLWAAFLMLPNETYSVQERERLQANVSGLAPYAFYFNEQSPVVNHSKIAEEIEKFYFGKIGGFLLNDSQTLYRLAHLYSDRWFVDSGVKFMELYAKQAPTYPYLYTYNKYVGLEFGQEEWHNEYHFDATHAAELDMMISPLFGKARNDKPDFDEVSKSITKLWVSFIKTGIPSATYGSERSFPPLDPKLGIQNWYRLDTDTELMDNSLFSERLSFWKSLSKHGLNDEDFDNCFC